MTREVDLVSYLPPFLAEFKEIAIALKAENPEFVLVWNATKRVLKNEYIETADEYGISRFENILKILPSKEDTLESRRARVQTRWFNTIPYTIRTFILKMKALCGNSDFSITKSFDYYRIDIKTNLELFGQVEELKNIIENVLPCNMVVVSINSIHCASEGVVFVAGGVCAVEKFFITNDNKEDFIVNSPILHGGGAINTATMVITDDFN